MLDTKQNDYYFEHDVSLGLRRDSHGGVLLVVHGYVMKHRWIEVENHPTPRLQLCVLGGLYFYGQSLYELVIQKSTRQCRE